MTEVWKDVVGYEGYYQVSNFGRVRSTDREVNCLRGQKRVVRGRVLAIIPCTNGYSAVRLSVKNKAKNMLVHRLVAEAFISNPNHLSIINHKDETRDNNSVENLEWCDRSYNVHYGDAIKKIRKSRKVKPVNQYSMDGKFIKRWDNILAAGNGVGVNHSSIMRVCQGKQHTSMGYKWEYAEPQVV